MTLPYFLKDFAPPFLTDQHCLVALHVGPDVAVELLIREALRHCPTKG
jgi:hypothetical protein